MYHLRTVHVSFAGQGSIMEKHYRPKLDPKRDLAGATPEALVRALFRRVQPPTMPLEDATELPNTTPENNHDRASRSDRTHAIPETHA